MGGASAGLKPSSIWSAGRQEHTVSPAERRHSLGGQKSCLSSSSRAAFRFRAGLVLSDFWSWPKVGVHSRPRSSAEPDERNKRMFIFGMGYTAGALAARLRRENWILSGTCRSKEKKEALESRGFDTFLFNSDNDGEDLQLSGLKALRNATHLMSTIPPVADFDKDPVLGCHYDDLLQLRTNGLLQWIGILSSTGVYGDHRGEWVDEETEVRPEDRRARARVEAEKSWLKLGKDIGTPVQVFRLGGIYGPGRSALDTVQLRNPQLSDRQKLREGRQYTSRVHVGDVCQAVLASIQYPSSGRVFNVVDDDPAPRSQVMEFARKLVKGCSVNASNPEVDMIQAGLATTRGKRVANRRIKDELHVKLLHPSYKEGLMAIAQGVRFPFE